jgi:hypothetical protein
MKVEFSYIIARNKLDRVVFCEPIQDCYSTVYMELCKEDGLTFDDVLEKGKSIFRIGIVLKNITRIGGRSGNKQ